MHGIKNICNTKNNISEYHTILNNILEIRKIKNIIYDDNVINKCEKILSINPENNTIWNFFKDMNVNGKFTNVNGKFTNVNGKFTNVNGKFMNINSKIITKFYKSHSAIAQTFIEQ